MLSWDPKKFGIWLLGKREMSWPLFLFLFLLPKKTNKCLGSCRVPASALRQLMFLGSGFGLFIAAVCGLTILYPHKLSRAWWKKICLSVQKQSRMNNTFERNSTCWITLLYLYLFHTTVWHSLPGITFLCHKIIILHFLCTFPKVSKMCHALFLSTMFRKKKMA